MEKTEVTINSDGSPVPIKQFSEYFFLLRAFYIMALEEVNFELEDDGDVVVAERTSDKVAESVLHKAASLSPREFNLIANKNLPIEEELYLDHIMRRNPFEVVFLGIGVALAAALIISGGKFEFGLTKLKIEIPPLGEGIAKLRKAISNKP